MKFFKLLYMRSYIKVSNELRAKLCAASGFTRQGVWRALCCLSNSIEAQDIRKLALDNGGKWVHDVKFVPDCYNESTGDQLFRQVFPNGISVVVNAETSTATIYKGEDALETYDHLTLKGWGNLLFRAQKMSYGQRVD